MVHTSFVKHGRIHPLVRNGAGFSFPSHLDPIKDFITKGIADAKEGITLQPRACDVRGAKRFDGQQCVIAKALRRTLHPQAVAVGRSLAYVVVNGLAIRFRMPPASKRLVEEFDSQGRVRKAPIELCSINPAWSMTKMRTARTNKPNRAGKTKRRAKKYEVRAIGGGKA